MTVLDSAAGWKTTRRFWIDALVGRFDLSLQLLACIDVPSF